MPSLTLLRHGQSIWNAKNKFTGWEDVGLSQQGIKEARNASQKIINENIPFDIAYTSVLFRAIKTLWIVLEEANKPWVPVIRAWELNERHYGQLQGLNKSDCAKKYGDDQIQIWRRSFEIPPPALDIDDPRWQGKDERYQHLPKGPPLSESLHDTYKRTVPYYLSNIKPLLKEGKNILIVAHGNSLRALIKDLDDLGEQEIKSLNIPTGIPLVYKFNTDLTHDRGRYLGDSEQVKAAQAAVADQITPK